MESDGPFFKRCPSPNRTFACASAKSWDWHAADAYTVENLYEFLSAHKLTHDPGADFHYSNVGMALLGHVMERRTGADYDRLVVSRICRPLKMDSTLITLTPELKSRLARGHWRDGKRSEHLDFQVMASAGSLFSTSPCRIPDYRIIRTTTTTKTPTPRIAQSKKSRRALSSDEKTGKIRIKIVFPKSPAGQAGVSPGLIIQKINGLSVERKTIKECLSMMAGPAGTKMRLELFDAKRNETKAVKLSKRKFLTATD